MHTPVGEDAQITATSEAHSEVAERPVTLSYKRVQYLSVLGVRLDQFGTTLASVEARFGAANVCINADTSTWRAKGSFAAKLKAFERHVHPRVLHGSRTWLLTDVVLHQLRVWENKTVASVLNLKRNVSRTVRLSMSGTSALVQES